MTTTTSYVPCGTRVLNTDDGEVGSVLNGFAYDPRTSAWTEYEVATQYGIECWERSQFILLSECESE